MRRGSSACSTSELSWQVGQLFLIPGMGDGPGARHDGHRLRRRPARVDGGQRHPARDRARLSVDRVHFQCQRAISRSRLWDPDSRVDRPTLPSAGRLQAEVGAMSSADAAAYDGGLDGWIAATLYEGPAKP
jgi:uncharacterized protein